jgi:hypothetical protein
MNCIYLHKQKLKLLYKAAVPIKLEIQAVVQHEYYKTTSSSGLAQPNIELHQIGQSNKPGLFPLTLKIFFVSDSNPSSRG